MIIVINTPDCQYVVEGEPAVRVQAQLDALGNAAWPGGAVIWVPSGDSQQAITTKRGQTLKPQRFLIPMRHVTAIWVGA